MNDRPMWGQLIHLGYNMWSDTPGEKVIENDRVTYSPDLRFDDELWREITQRMADSGQNTLVLDVADGVRYASHPEIAVNGAWEREKLVDELARLRELGLEPLPKLNFSTCHDTWLGVYSRQVSTPIYYEVCANVIREVAELFGGPRLFHIGMDEESIDHQRAKHLAVVRQHDLWWHDLEFLAQTVRDTGARPWVWADSAWRHPQEFYARMAKDIVQSNWYYLTDFPDDSGVRPRVLAEEEGHLTYLDLEEHGFDQVATGSSWIDVENFAATVAYADRHIGADRLLGFLQTPWLPTLPEFRDRHLETIDAVGRAIAARQSLVRSA